MRTSTTDQNEISAEPKDKSHVQIIFLKEVVPSLLNEEFKRLMFQIGCVSLLKWSVSIDNWRHVGNELLW